jgi:hypothetical protein
MDEPAQRGHYGRDMPDHRAKLIGDAISGFSM